MAKGYHLLPVRLVSEIACAQGSDLDAGANPPATRSTIFRSSR